MIYVTDCPAEKVEKVRDWMIEKDAEMFDGMTQEKANMPDAHTGVMRIRIEDDGIEYECNVSDPDREHDAEEKIRHFFDMLKEEFPFLCLDGDFCLDDHSWGIYSDPGSTEVDLWDSDHVEPEYCRICGCEIISKAFWSDWTGTTCVCSPECACEATLDYLLKGNDGSMKVGNNNLYVRFDGGVRRIMPDVLIPQLPEYADRVINKDNVILLLKALDSRRCRKKIGDGDLEPGDVFSARAVMMEYTSKMRAKAFRRSLPAKLAEKYQIFKYKCKYGD